MKVTRVSRYTGKEHTLEIDITASQLQLIENGAHVKKIVPHLSPDMREFLITGMTPEEWEKIFEEEEGE